MKTKEIWGFMGVFVVISLLAGLVFSGIYLIVCGILYAAIRYGVPLIVGCLMSVSVGAFITRSVYLHGKRQTKEIRR